MTDLNRFVLRISLFVLPQAIIVSGFAYYFAFNTYALLPYEQLYQYQVGKISQADKFDTIFIGDSSLGNLIDAEYFSEETGQKAMNLALMGSYGYAGSYNMLKRAYAKNPDLKNVFYYSNIGYVLQRSVSSGICVFHVRVF